MIRLQVDKIERLRKQIGKTQRDVASSGNIGLRTYQRIVNETREGGAPNVTVGTINGICNALNVSYIEIMEHIPDLQPQ